MRQPSGKPNSVGPRPLARVRAGDHSSGTGIADGLEQPTRRLRTGRPRAPPYLVLLRAGFCLPRPSPAARCALTAPFHPYSPSLSPCELERWRAVYFLCHFPSGCPARALPGALPCGVRTFLQQEDLHPLPAIAWTTAALSILHAGLRHAAFGLRSGGLRRSAFGVHRSAFGVPPSAFLYPSFSCEISYCSSFL